jgi:hypothetical protein
MLAFRQAVEAQDMQAAVACLADDVHFRSPIVFREYHGRDEVGMVLMAVSRVFADFRYDREIGSEQDADHALVFRARVGDRDLEGVDLLHTNADGQVDELVVMVRPMSAALALQQAMAEMLAQASPGATP